MAYQFNGEVRTDDPAYAFVDMGTGVVLGVFVKYGGHGFAERLVLQAVDVSRARRLGGETTLTSGFVDTSEIQSVLLSPGVAVISIGTYQVRAYLVIMDGSGNITVYPPVEPVYSGIPDIAGSLGDLWMYESEFWDIVSARLLRRNEDAAVLCLTLNAWMKNALEGKSWTKQIGIGYLVCPIRINRSEAGELLGLERGEWVLSKYPEYETTFDANATLTNSGLGSVYDRWVSNQFDYYTGTDAVIIQQRWGWLMENFGGTEWTQRGIRTYPDTLLMGGHRYFVALGVDMNNHYAETVPNIHAVGYKGDRIVSAAQLHDSYLGGGQAWIKPNGEDFVLYAGEIFIPETCNYTIWAEDAWDPVLPYGRWQSAQGIMCIITDMGTVYSSGNVSEARDYVGWETPTGYSFGEQLSLCGSLDPTAETYIGTVSVRSPSGAWANFSGASEAASVSSTRVLVDASVWNVVVSVNIRKGDYELDHPYPNHVYKRWMPDPIVPYYHYPFVIRPRCDDFGWGEEVQVGSLDPYIGQSADAYNRLMSTRMHGQTDEKALLIHRSAPEGGTNA